MSNIKYKEFNEHYDVQNWRQTILGQIVHGETRNL